MAEHLASIFGTEKDRVNCPFYFKIGACRHGDRCSRLHTKPSISPTILLSNMYQRPDMITPGVDAHGNPIDPRKIQDHFEEFYEDLFEELSKYGEIESLNVCDNLADHMVSSLTLALILITTLIITLGMVIFRWETCTFSSGRRSMLPVLLGTSLEGFMPVSYLLFSWFSAISQSFCISEVHQCTSLFLLNLSIELF